MLRNICFVVVIFSLSTTLIACTYPSPSEDSGTVSFVPEWQEEFDLAERKLEPNGEATYFILIPGFSLTLKSETETLVISVLEETRMIGGIMTRVVEEREHKNEELYEVSTNFFAIDSVSGDVFYFGEEVDFYSRGQVTGHSGAWLAFENGNQPGMIMPGKPEVGMKYYQEIAPGVATDRARVVSTSETITTLAGEFEGCLLTQESSKLNPAIEYKTYCPGIGLVQDQSLVLTSYGYEKP